MNVVQHAPTLSYQLRFRRYVRLFAAISALMIVVLAGTLIVVFERNMQEEVSRRTLEVLKKNSQFPVFYNEISRTVSSQLYLSERVQAVLPSQTLTAQERVALLSEMKRVASSMPFLYSITFFHAASDTILVSEENVQSASFQRTTFPDPSYLEILEHYGSYGSFRPVVRRARLLSTGEERFIYTYLMYNYYPVGELNFVIALNFLEEDFARFQDAQTEGGVQYAISSEGVVQIGNEFFDPLSRLDERDYISTIILSPLQAGYFITEATGGNEHLVTFYRSKQTGWIFVSEHAYSSIARAVANMRITLIVIVLVVIAVLLFLFTPLNRKVLTTTRSMVSEMEGLEKERSELRQVARRKFLRDLVAGTVNPDLHYGYIEDDGLLDDSGGGHHETASRSPRPFLLFMLKHCRLVPGDSLNVWQLSVKLQSGLADHASIVEHIDYGPGTLLYLVRLSAPTSVACREALRKHVLETEEMRGFSVGFASPSEDVEEMQRWSGEAHALAHALFFSRGGELVVASEVRQKHDFIYPDERERAMLEALLSCDPEACKEIIRAILFATEAYDQIALHMTAYRVIYEIKKALLAGRVEESKIAGLAPLITSMTHDTDVYSFSTVYTLIDRLEDVVDSVCSVLSNRRENKRQQLVDEVDELIRLHYKDQSFHLGEIARMVDLNPRYLSRVYKQETGESVPKRLARVRIEAVKEELRTTDRPIRDIVHDSGLSENPYFFRIFKDYTGTTPKQYRVLSGSE